LSPPRTTTQPTLGLGEKAGRAAGAPGAAEADKTPAQAQSKPTVRDGETDRDTANLRAEFARMTAGPQSRCGRRCAVLGDQARWAPI
jgi:hypothetical protein